MCALARIDCHARSERGRARRENGDGYLLAELERSMRIHETSLTLPDGTVWCGTSEGQVFVLADAGMRAGGERASAAAVDAVARRMIQVMPSFFRLDIQCRDELYRELRHAVERAREGGAAVTASYLLWPRLYIAGAGSNRSFLQRGSRLEQIATRSLEIERVELELDDTLLFATDGLAGAITEDRIRETLRVRLTAREACERLVSEAVENGAADDMTAVVVKLRRFEEDAPAVEELEAMVDEEFGAGTPREVGKRPAVSHRLLDVPAVQDRWLER